MVPPPGTARLAGPAAEPAARLGFPGTEQSPPLVRAPGGALAPRGGGAAILLSPLDVTQPGPWLLAAVFFTAAWEV